MPVWSVRAILLAILVVAAVPVERHAEVPPSRTYTPADGLPGLDVRKIVPDSRGFLWLCTSDGLARFDGYAMTSYGVRDGLPDRRVGDLLETKSGEYWVSTAAGLCRLDARGERRFVAVRLGDDEASNETGDLVEASDGAVLCATSAGVYRIDTRDGAPAVSFLEAAGPKDVESLCLDRSGNLWLGGLGELRRLAPDGHLATIAVPTDVISAGQAILCIHVDAGGRLWVGTKVGLFTAPPDATGAAPAAITQVTENAPGRWVSSIFETRDRTLWVTATSGLWRRVSGESVVFERSRRLDDACSLAAWCAAEDRDGVFWVGTECGAIRLDRSGFTRYTAADGLLAPYVASLSLSREGRVVATLFLNGRVVEGFDGQRFSGVKAAVPPSVTYFGWGWGQVVAEDLDGGWWLTVGTGLLRYRPAARIDLTFGASPHAIDLGREAFRVFEDSHGDVWASLTNQPGLVRFAGGAEPGVDVTAEAGGGAGEFTAFAETRDGAVWIGTSVGELIRYSGGRFERFGADAGVPRGWLRALFVDDAGRLWVASSQVGVARVDDPSTARPSFVPTTMADGLASDNTWSITEDAYHRIYVGSQRGVDRIDLATGRVKHYTTDDGAPKGFVKAAVRDRDGRLWFGSDFGLARFDPEPEREREAPRTLLVGVRVSGVARPISALGETEAAPLDLAPNENVVSVDFVGLGATLGEEVRYQYRLEGSTGEWSAPSVERSVTFANLAPGSYHFFVRAVDADGLESPEPASVAFTVATPVWRRWWFVALALAFAAGAAYAFYRYRLARLLEVERVRTRIATDLHDDIGANLTKIAALSDVANFRLSGDGRASDESLSSIARISRESVASMSDIVWAVNPGRDSLRDLARRMRQFASDAFVPRGVALRFSVPETVDPKLGDDLRRQVYLVFKEAVSNAARHSGCAEAEVSLSIDGRAITLSVSDDGRGFDTSAEPDGNGLANMRRRAGAVGGALVVMSEVGRGTTVTLVVPLRGGAPPKTGRVT